MVSMRNVQILLTLMLQNSFGSASGFFKAELFSEHYQLFRLTCYITADVQNNDLYFLILDIP